MAWTTPRTWVAGEVVTAAIGNAHWRDNLAYLHGDAGNITYGNAALIVQDGYGAYFQQGATFRSGLVGGGATLYVGRDATNPFSYLHLGYGSIISIQHSTANFAFGFDPSGGGAGIPRLSIYNSAGAEQGIIQGDGGSGIKVGGTGAGIGLMSAHRHPYLGQARHIESGTATYGGAGAARPSFSVTFSDAFSATPNIAVTAVGGSTKTYANVESVSTTGMTAYLQNTDGTNVINGTIVNWIAEGRDA